MQHEEKVLNSQTKFTGNNGIMECWNIGILE